MLSSSDLERLIAVKKIEIEEEKTQLGLSPLRETSYVEDDKENAGTPSKPKKQVNFTQSRALCQRNDVIAQKKKKDSVAHQELEDKIPPDLERYIRRYLGMPVMLKAGEYSPNNPLIRGERAPGDALLGLGEYERQRHTLRRIRQQQYREYLDQQAKKKQEAKEQVERERREREEREIEREQRERELLRERDRQRSPERRRCTEHAPVTSTVYCSNKVDTGVQVDGFTRPLSVAVQTDEAELFRLSPSPTKSQLTQAERELSPRTVGEPPGKWGLRRWDRSPPCERRRSYGDYDERSSTVLRKCNRDKLASDLRHSYMPSIFDADAIRLRNEQAEKEAAERRQYYQQELKNQILEQQRIREERKNREKMLEQAEMRRLEEQLRMLRVAQERELGKQHDITAAMKENSTDYNSKRTELQKEIDGEQQKLRRPTALSTRSTTKGTNHSDNPSKLPFYYPKTYTPTTPDRINPDKKPYSMNIPDNSIFSANYDVDSYLRRNLNFNKDKMLNLDNVHIESDGNKFVNTNPNHSHVSPNVKMTTSNSSINKNDGNDYLSNNKTSGNARNIKMSAGNDSATIKRGIKNDSSRKMIDEAAINDYNGRPNENKPSGDDNFDTLPIPVLKHTPPTQASQPTSTMSDKMQVIDDKWKVPIIQKNILKSMPNEEGKNVSILTQLGSIRRQLQLEQLRLDGMLNKDDLK